MTYNSRQVYRLLPVATNKAYYYLTTCKEKIFSRQKERIGQALLERLKEFDVAAWTNKQSPITFVEE